MSNINEVVTLRQFRFLTTGMNSLVLYEHPVVFVQDKSFDPKSWREFVLQMINLDLMEVIATIDLRNSEDVSVSNNTNIDIEEVISRNNGDSYLQMLQITSYGVKVWMECASDVEFLYLNNVCVAVHNLTLPLFLSRHADSTVDENADDTNSDDTDSYDAGIGNVDIPLSSAFTEFIDTLGLK